jgi:hypothetical protein
MADEKPKPKLFDGKGKPVSSTSAPKPPKGAFDAFAELGIKDAGDYVMVDKETIRAVQRDSARRWAMTSAPSTPINLMRDVGGAVEKGIGRHSAMTMGRLRELRERAPILQPIHQQRMYATRKMATRWNGKRGHVGLRVVHKDHHEHDADPPEGIEPFIRQFENVLESPAAPYGVRTMKDLCTLLMEDLLTINRPALELIPSAVDPSRIVQLRPVDGALLWPTLQWMEKYKRDNRHWSGGHSQHTLSAHDEVGILSELLQLDLYGTEYVIVQDGMPISAHKPGRFIIAPIQNRTDVEWVGYPPSHVEMAVHLLAAFIATFDYNHTLFTRGMLTEFIFGVTGDVHDDDLDAFVDMMREATQGVNRAWQPPIMPLPAAGAIEKIDLKGNPTEMGFEIWTSLIIALTTGIYRMDPSSINAKPWDGGSGPKLGEANRQQEINLAKEEGLQGDLGHILDNILTPAAQRCHPDLRVIAEWADFDPEKEARVYEIRSRVDMTRNEIRMEQGLKPRGFHLTPEEYEKASDEDKQKHDDSPWNWPTDSVFAGAINSAKQNEMFAEQQEEGAPGDGFGGEDDGFGGGPPGQPPGNAGAGPGGPPPFGQPPQDGPTGEQDKLRAMMKGRKSTPIVVHVHDS